MTVARSHASLAGNFRAKRDVKQQPDESSGQRALLKSMLLPDENILQVGKISYGIYWKTIAVLFFGMLFVLIAFLMGLPGRLGILFALAISIKVIIMTVVAYLTRHYLLLVATDKRVILRVGILNLEIIQLRYSKVESSEVASTIAGRFFGYSSVFISGTGGHILAVPFIENALAIRNAISEILLKRDDLEEHALMGDVASHG